MDGWVGVQHNDLAAVVTQELISLVKPDLNEFKLQP